MPWKETSVLEEREAFIREMLLQERPFKHLCTEYGISEKTGYKWKKRFEEEGKRGLFEQSKAPHTSPNKLSEDVITRLVKLKVTHEHWGPKKIHAIYERTYGDAPSLSSVTRVLSKAGLVKKRRIKKAVVESHRLRQYIEPQAVNDVWAIDFKGWWKSSGEVCEPLTVRDLHSRMILEVRLMRSRSSEAVREVMTELFKKYGLPKVIRSDNGIPFVSSNGVLNLTNLSTWWITLGITPDRTDKGSPGQNGSLERMHGDIAREIEGTVKGGIAANQAALDAWREEYNTVRPNEAIGMLTPAQLYHPSERKYEGDFDEIEYPPGFLTRKVFPNGETAILGLRVYISYSLRGLHIGLRPTGHNRYDVFLADFPLGSVDVDSCCFTPLDALE